MKNLITATLVGFLISFSTSAQDFEAPKKGAKIYVEDNSIEINQNDEVSFDLYLIKSRAARRANFENPRFLAPDGLEFYIKQNESNPSHYSIIAKATEIEAGDYSITVTGRTSGIHSVTGTILSINVKSASTVASTDGE